MEFRSKKILISGGTGFIGGHLAKELMLHNKVWIMGRRENSLVNKEYFIKGDITKQNFAAIFKKNRFDYFFHLAGTNLNFAFQNPIADFKTNAYATLKILDAVKHLSRKPKFIFASSVAVYGACQDRKLNENRSLAIPISNYGASKLAGESYVRAFARQYGVPAISLRLFSTYGPGLRRQIVYDFIHRLSLNPQKLEILGDGSQARDFVFIADQVKNILRVASQANYKGEIYNLCSGKLYTTKKIAHSVANAMGLKPEFIFTNKARIFDGQSWLGDNSKIKKLGCVTSISLQEGIKKTVEWYNNQIS